MLAFYPSRRYLSARAVARRLGVPLARFFLLYASEALHMPRPSFVRGQPRWDMVRVEYWLDTLAHTQPPAFEDWLQINGHRVAPYTGGWSLLGLLRPLVGGKDTTTS